MFARVLAPLAVASSFLTCVVPTVSATPTSPFDLFSRTPAAGIDVNSLAPYLSATAKIYLPDTKEFATYTTRWSNLQAPTPSIVIAPGTEKDVQKIVSLSVGGRARSASAHERQTTAADTFMAGQVCQ